MTDQTYYKNESEIKQHVIEMLDRSVSEYLDKFVAGSDGKEAPPSINDVEEMLSALFSKTRDIYLRMAMDVKNHYEHSGTPDSKSPSKKRGAQAS